MTFICRSPVNRKCEARLTEFGSCGLLICAKVPYTHVLMGACAEFQTITFPLSFLTLAVSGGSVRSRFHAAVIHLKTVHSALQEGPLWLAYAAP